MKLNDINVNSMYETMMGAKKISKLPFELDQFRNWCYTLNAINAMEYGMTMLGAYPVSEYKIPTALKEMVVPSKVNMVISDIATDFKGAVYFQQSSFDGRVLSPVQFNIVTKGIVGARRSADNGVAVDTLRVASTISNVHDRAYLDGTEHCYKTTNAYCPMALSTAFIDINSMTEHIDFVFDTWFLEVYSKLD